VEEGETCAVNEKKLEQPTDRCPREHPENKNHELVAVGKSIAACLAGVDSDRIVGTERSIGGKPRPDVVKKGSSQGKVRKVSRDRDESLRHAIHRVRRFGQLRKKVL